MLVMSEGESLLWDSRLPSRVQVQGKRWGVPVDGAGMRRLWESLPESRLEVV